VDLGGIKIDVDIGVSICYCDGMNNNDIHNYTIAQLVNIREGALKHPTWTPMFSFKQIEDEFNRRRELYRANGDHNAEQRYNNIWHPGISMLLWGTIWNATLFYA